METLISIREKLKKFLFEVNSDDITMNSAIDKFKSLFSGEYEKINASEVEPYYQSYSQTYYIKNGYGIGLQKSWGRGDIFGNSSSHKGVDLTLISPLADNIDLWYESEHKKDTADVNVLFSFDPSVSSLQNRLLDSSCFKSVYPFLPSDVVNHETFSLAFYNNLRLSAQLSHNREVEADRISYYGGLDVTIHDEEEHLLDSLCEFEENPTFLQIAVPLFVMDYPGYLDNQIAECKHALYIISHKEKFFKLATAEKSFYTLSIQRDDIRERLNTLKTEIAKANSKLMVLSRAEKEYQNREYNFVAVVKGMRYKDRQAIKSIESDKQDIKSKITILSDKVNEMQDSLAKVDSSFNEKKDELETIKKSLDYPYRNFELDPDLEQYEFYVNGNYYMNENIDRLVKHTGKYNERLRMLSILKSYDTDSPSEDVIQQMKDISSFNKTKSSEINDRVKRYISKEL